MRILSFLLGMGLLGSLFGIDLRHYPGIPVNHNVCDDKVLLNAKHWKASPGFSIASDCDG